MGCSGFFSGLAHGQHGHYQTKHHNKSNDADDAGGRAVKAKHHALPYNAASAARRRVRPFITLPSFLSHRANCSFAAA